MSGLNTYFLPLTILQEQFWDKLTDAPLAGGKLYFFQDEARTIPKAVYVLTGSPPDYTYDVASPSATSITLSSIGTVNDGSGNNLVIYGYPYDDDQFDGSGNIQLYYMAVHDSDGTFQFSVGGFPNVPFEEIEQASGHEKNFIKNGQFVLNDGAKSISATSTELAYGDWYYVRSSNTATDAVSFTRFGSPIEGGSPSANPRYACNVSCTITGTDSYKALEIKFNDVNRFSDTVQTLSLFFEAKSAVGSSISVDLYKYFGSGGSSPISEQIIESTVLDSVWTPVTTQFAFGSNVGQTLGPNNDDYFSIRVMFPPASTFNISLTDFCMFLGSEQITQYPFGVDSYNDNQISTLNTQVGVINTTLSDMLSLHILSLTTPYSFSIATGWQAIAGTALTLSEAGTYILSYNCSVYLSIQSTAFGYQISTKLNNNTSATYVDGSVCMPIACTGNSSTVSMWSGVGSSTTVVKITVPSTFQIYASTSYYINIVAFSAQFASISAIKIG